MGDAQAYFQFRAIDLKAGLGKKLVEVRQLFFPPGGFSVFLQPLPSRAIVPVSGRRGYSSLVDDVDALSAHPVSIDEDVHPIDAGRQKVAGFEAG